MNFLFLLSALSICCFWASFNIATSLAPVTHQEVEAKDYWIKLGQSELQHHLYNIKPNTNTAKNVILFVGDGMGLSTVTAAGILKGQINGGLGEGTKLTFEKFPHVALSKVYNTNQQVPDSAGTATAFMCGVKTRAGVVALDNTVPYANCTAVTEEAKIDSILKWAQHAGKSTGIVTTTRVTHATPAVAYAHSPSRSWEYKAPDGCQDIASQLLTHGHNINVVLGGGRRNFLPYSERDPESRRRGYRLDGRNLIKEWKKMHSKKNSRAQFIWNQTAFEQVNAQETDYLLGLFQYSHMNYESDRLDDRAGEPSLSQMTVKALEMLQKNDEGYFLLVEGGRIDHGHHSNKAAKALNEVLAFDRAIEDALDMVKLDDTLVVVTADHSHVMTVAGYPKRGNPILGMVGPSVLARDDLPYTTLLYGNGPGFSSPRSNISDAQLGDMNYRHQAAVPLYSETHSGEDVPIYATGPLAHLFSGVYEQSYIAHVIGYASCIGPNKNHCRKTMSIEELKKLDDIYVEETKKITLNKHNEEPATNSTVHIEASKKNGSAGLHGVNMTLIVVSVVYWLLVIVKKI